MKRVLPLCCVAFSWVVTCTIPLRAADEATFRKEPVSVHWNAVPLCESLGRLAQDRRFDVWIDRRLDPRQAIRIDSNQEALDTLVTRLAESQNCGAAWHERLLYLGPKDRAEMLLKIITYQQERTRRLPEPLRKKFTARAALKYPILTTPHELLEHLAHAAGLHWSNLDQLPHDLWNANELQPLPLCDRLTLLLIGFDLTFEVDSESNTLTLVPLEKVPYERLAVTPEAETPRPAGAEVTTEQEKKRPPIAQRRFTLQLRGMEFGKFLESLGRQLDVEVRVNTESLTKRGIDLTKPIDIDVKNTTATGLFRAATEQVGARFTIRGNVVEIH